MPPEARHSWRPFASFDGAATTSSSTCRGCSSRRFSRDSRERARVVGFSSGYLRERLARPFYTEVYDPGGGGMYDPRERSHVVQMNLGLLTAIGLTVSAPEFPIERVDTEVARAMRERAGNRYAARQPRGGLAQQALAGRAVRGRGARDSRSGMA